MFVVQLSTYPGVGTTGEIKTFVSSNKIAEAPEGGGGHLSASMSVAGEDEVEGDSYI